MSRQQQQQQQQQYHPSKSMATLHLLREQYQRELAALAEEKRHDHHDDDRDHSNTDESGSSQSSSPDDGDHESTTAPTPSSSVPEKVQTNHLDHHSPKDVRSILAFHHPSPSSPPPSSSSSAAPSIPVPVPKVFGHACHSTGLSSLSRQDTEKASNVSSTTTNKISNTKRDREDELEPEQLEQLEQTDQVMYDPLNPDEVDEQSLADLLSDCCPSNDFSSLLGDSEGEEYDYEDNDGPASSIDRNRSSGDGLDGGGRRSSLVRSVSNEEGEESSPDNNVFDWDVTDLYGLPVAFGAVGCNEEEHPEENYEPQTKRARYVE
eukprot:CAMPEP_0113454748 /NCGR_PEP_ID=MMETSP0014_2-20120614/8023_1 /TAXON_ID=2857 /ORGANISM="Nitzschia sp." /LENGTH=319 /DNA_ID=CAMNT_0000346163 /DNA_START=820 /DNA_END=1779 /DNA_ORIENTATION=+ /assembly_acc=CAM_ASM_000159